MHRVTAVACLLAALTGCTRERGPKPGPPVAGRALVAVLPFRTGGVLDEHAAFAPGADPGAVFEDAGPQAARSLAVRLIGVGVPVASADRVLAVTPPTGAAVYDARLGARVATNTGANLAVVGAITRYVEREGSALGVRTPASVAYQAALVRTPDGAIVALDRFDYTQQPLTSNLLDLPRFVRAGGCWVTREELLEGALGETAEKFASALHVAGGR
jgi:hypothetical protein